MSVMIHPTALIEEGVRIGAGSSIWDNVHIRRSASIGEECIIGEKSYIAYDVKIGNRVMISAGTIFTNDRFPRATTSDLKRLCSSAPDEHTLPTLVREGATIGAGATIGNDLVIGRFAMVGMGSLVTKSIPDFHLALGHPAKSVGVVCRCGLPILRFSEVSIDMEQEVRCSACGLRYELRNRSVVEIEPPVVSSEEESQGPRGKARLDIDLSQV